MRQRRTGTADYTTPAKPKAPDALYALDGEYERLSGKQGLLYVSSGTEYGRKWHFGDGTIKTSRAAAIRYLMDLLKPYSGTAEP